MHDDFLDSSELNSFLMECRDGLEETLLRNVQSKAFVFLLAAKVQLFALPPAILSTKDGLQVRLVELLTCSHII